MFTANVAGTAGSHLRSDAQHRDSNSHSRPNLHELDRDSLGDEEKRQLRSHPDYANGGDPESQSQCNKTFRWLSRNYKACAYMCCLGSIIVGGIVIIILAAMGIISTTNDR